MQHVIKGVSPLGIASELGIKKGDVLISINDSEIKDFVDYEFLSNLDNFTMMIQTFDGETLEFVIEKDEDEFLGIEFENEFMAKHRSCANKCIFCFIDQMPKNCRDSLYFKDDDWRLSLMMGNYLTLTNVNDKELQRIIDRKVSPLYISVHATDKDVRAKMIVNKNADIMSKLKFLIDGGVSVHCQIVLCKGINDGAVLKKSLDDLLSLGENCKSVAIVPVGITKFRKGLYPVNQVDEACANATIDTVNYINQKAKDTFAFAADEIYITAKRDLPSFITYGDFEQIEDGIGMYRMFQHDFLRELNELERNKEGVLLLCGTSIEPYLQELLNKLPNKRVKAKAIINNFFGSTITVSGLVTGGDIIKQVKDENCDTVIIPRDMLRHSGDLFLDDVSIDEVKKALLPKKTVVLSGAVELLDYLKID